MDDVSLAAAARTSPYRFPPGAGAALLVETDGNDEEQVLAELVRLAALVEGDAQGEVIVAQNEAQRRDIWETRRYLSVNLKRSTRSSSPRTWRCRARRSRRWWPGPRRPARGSASTSPPTATPATGTSTATSCSIGPRSGAGRRGGGRSSCGDAVDLGGTITGEHGVGIAKRDFLEYEQGADLLNLQRRLKAFFDPLGILNPGKISRSGDSSSPRARAGPRSRPVCRQRWGRTEALTRRKSAPRLGSSRRQAPRRIEGRFRSTISLVVSRCCPLPRLDKERAGRA